MPKPRRWRKNFPYYKVQIFNEIVYAWKDEKDAFDSVDAANSYIAERAKPPRVARIVVVEGERDRHVLRA